MPAHTEPSVGPASVENHHSTEISPTANLRVNNTIKTLRVSSLGSTAYEEQGIKKIALMNSPFPYASNFRSDDQDLGYVSFLVPKQPDLNNLTLGRGNDYIRDSQSFPQSQIKSSKKGVKKQSGENRAHQKRIHLASKLQNMTIESGFTSQFVHRSGDDRNASALSSFPPTITQFPALSQTFQHHVTKQKESKRQSLPFSRKRHEAEKKIAESQEGMTQVNRFKELSLHLRHQQVDLTRMLSTAREPLTSRSKFAALNAKARTLVPGSSPDTKKFLARESKVDFNEKQNIRKKNPITIENCKLPIGHPKCNQIIKVIEKFQNQLSMISDNEKKSRIIRQVKNKSYFDAQKFAENLQQSQLVDCPSGHSSNGLSQNRVPSFLRSLHIHSKEQDILPKEEQKSARKLNINSTKIHSQTFALPIFSPSSNEWSNLPRLEQDVSSPINEDQELGLKTIASRTNDSTDIQNSGDKSRNHPQRIEASSSLQIHQINTKSSKDIINRMSHEIGINQEKIQKFREMGYKTQLSQPHGNSTRQSLETKVSQHNQQQHPSTLIANSLMKNYYNSRMNLVGHTGLFNTSISPGHENSFAKTGYLIQIKTNDPNRGKPSNLAHHQMRASNSNAHNKILAFRGNETKTDRDFNQFQSIMAKNNSPNPIQQRQQAKENRQKIEASTAQIAAMRKSSINSVLVPIGNSSSGFHQFSDAKLQENIENAKYESIYGKNWRETFTREVQHQLSGHIVSPRSSTMIDQRNNFSTIRADQGFQSFIGNTFSKNPPNFLLTGGPEDFGRKESLGNGSIRGRQDSGIMQKILSAEDPFIQQPNDEPNDEENEFYTQNTRIIANLSPQEFTRNIAEQHLAMLDRELTNLTAEHKKSKENLTIGVITENLLLAKPKNQGNESIYDSDVFSTTMLQDSKYLKTQYSHLGGQTQRNQPALRHPANQDLNQDLTPQLQVGNSSFTSNKIKTKQGFIKKASKLKIQSSLKPKNTSIAQEVSKKPLVPADQSPTQPEVELQTRIASLQKSMFTGLHSHSLESNLAQYQSLKPVFNDQAAVLRDLPHARGNGESIGPDPAQSKYLVIKDSLQVQESSQPVQRPHVLIDINQQPNLSSQGGFRGIGLSDQSTLKALSPPPAVERMPTVMLHIDFLESPRKGLGLTKLQSLSPKQIRNLERKEMIQNQQEARMKLTNITLELPNSIPLSRLEQYSEPQQQSQLSFGMPMPNSTHKNAGISGPMTFNIQNFNARNQREQGKVTHALSSVSSLPAANDQSRSTIDAIFSQSQIQVPFNFTPFPPLKTSPFGGSQTPSGPLNQKIKSVLNIQDPPHGNEIIINRGVESSPNAPQTLVDITGFNSDTIQFQGTGLPPSNDYADQLKFAKITEMTSGTNPSKQDFTKGQKSHTYLESSKEDAATKLNGGNSSRKIIEHLRNSFSSNHSKNYGFRDQMKIEGFNSSAEIIKIEGNTSTGHSKKQFQVKPSRLNTEVAIQIKDKEKIQLSSRDFAHQLMQEPSFEMSIEYETVQDLEAPKITTQDQSISQNKKDTFETKKSSTGRIKVQVVPKIQQLELNPQPNVSSMHQQQIGSPRKKGASPTFNNQTIRDMQGQKMRNFGGSKKKSSPNLNK